MKGSENVETYDEYSGVFRYMLVNAECAVGEECVFFNSLRAIFNPSCAKYTYLFTIYVIPSQ